MITVILKVINHDPFGLKRLSNTLNSYSEGMRVRAKVEFEIANLRSQYPEYKIPEGVKEYIDEIAGNTNKTIREPINNYELKRKSAIKYLKQSYYYKNLEDWHYEDAAVNANIDYYKNYQRRNEFNKPYHDQFCTSAQMYLLKQSQMIGIWGQNRDDS